MATEPSWEQLLKEKAKSSAKTALGTPAFLAATGVLSPEVLFRTLNRSDKELGLPEQEELRFGPEDVLPPGSYVRPGKRARGQIKDKGGYLSMVPDPPTFKKNSEGIESKLSKSNETKATIPEITEMQAEAIGDKRKRGDEQVVPEKRRPKKVDEAPKPEAEEKPKPKSRESWMNARVQRMIEEGRGTQPSISQFSSPGTIMMEVVGGGKPLPGDAALIESVPRNAKEASARMAAIARAGGSRVTYNQDGPGTSLVERGQPDDPIRASVVGSRFSNLNENIGNNPNLERRAFQMAGDDAEDALAASVRDQALLGAELQTRGLVTELDSPQAVQSKMGLLGALGQIQNEKEAKAREAVAAILQRMPRAKDEDPAAYEARVRAAQVAEYNRIVRTPSPMELALLSLITGKNHPNLGFGSPLGTGEAAEAAFESPDPFAALVR